MKQTIQELWNGNIAPGENCGVGQFKIERIAVLMERNREALNQELGQQQKAIFEKYIDCSEEYLGLLSEQAFCDGFCLGSRLMAEVLQK